MSQYNLLGEDIEERSIHVPDEVTKAILKSLPLMIYHQSNNRETPSWRLDSENESVKDLPLASNWKLNHHTTKEHQI